VQLPTNRSFGLLIGKSNSTAPTTGSSAYWREISFSRSSTRERKHPFPRDRIVLTGRTAINPFYLDLARLSVDTDRNDIAQVESDQMLAERPDVVREVDQVATGLG
jgi:hypothetical protein